MFRNIFFKEEKKAGRRAIRKNKNVFSFGKQLKEISRRKMSLPISVIKL